MESNFVSYLATNAGYAVPKQHFWIPFWPSWCKAMTGAAIQSGFRKTGIFPVNRRMIKGSDLGLSATTDNTVNLKGKMYSEMVVNYVCVVFIFAISLPVILFWRQFFGTVGRFCIWEMLQLQLPVAILLPLILFWIKKSSLFLFLLVCSSTGCS